MTTCNHEGCDSTDVTACFLPDNETDTPDEHYCATHAHEHGWCWGCGQFWGGVESFDFGSYYGNVAGLCDNCSDAVKDDFDDFDDDDYEPIDCWEVEV